MGQLLSPSGQNVLLAGIVSQADVPCIFSPPEQEIRREVTDRVILQGLLMDPDRLQATLQEASRRVRPENEQFRRDVIEAVRHIESVATVWDQLVPADDHLHTATS